MSVSEIELNELQILKKLNKSDIPDDEDKKILSRISKIANKVLTNPYFLVGPAMLLLCTFSLYPLIFGFAVSLSNWNIVKGTMKFIGLKNYINLFHQKAFTLAFSNTIIFVFCSVVLLVAISLLGAIFLNKKTKFHNIVQSIAFTPYILPTVSIAMLWLWLMDKKVGLINMVLQSFGIHSVGWLTDKRIALYSIILIQIWQFFGYTTLLIMSGLQSIPTNVYEAAKLDKASKWRTFKDITIPLLSPTLFFVVVISMINAAGAFDIVQVLTKGGPTGSTNLIAYYIYQSGFEFFKMGQAAAASMVLFILISIVSLINFTFLGNKVHYQ